MKSTDLLKLWATKRYSLMAALAAVALLGGLGGWAALAELSGAVIALGEVRVERNRQVVQHSFGGSVGEILVRDGDRVNAQDVLLRLDATRLKAERAIVQNRLDESRARQARLRAERDGEASIPYAEDLVTRAAEHPGVAEILKGQERLFQARAATHSRAQAQLRSRIAQIRDEITGLEGQVAAATKQRTIIREDLVRLEGVLAKGYVRRERVINLRLEETRINRDIASFISQIAAAHSRIGENEIALVRLDAERIEEIVTELRDLGAQLSEFQDELVKIDDQLSRTEIRAPVSGVVHASAVHTIGAVIQPAQPILFIVPQAEELIVEVRVEPESIDQLQFGQAVTVRFPAFNSRTTPELEGTIRKISADRIIEEASGLTYYLAEVFITPQELRRLAGLNLIPGMPAEAHIRTTTRTLLSYLLKPLLDNFQRALREG